MIYFEKLHGLGNDFIIFNAIDDKLPNYNELAKKVCDRHFGIGADGMMVVEKSDTADVQMLFFNADGTQARMCGNGIRCFSKYVYDHKIVDKKSFEVETLAGIMKPEVYLDGQGIVETVRVNLGKPGFDPKMIPVDTDKEKYIDETIEIDGKEYKISAISMGSIHAVVYVKDLKDFPLNDLGPKMERHPVFPEGINVNYCKIVDDQNFEILTWERGVGQTLACGTGASAAVVIASELYNTSQKVNVSLLGGDVTIEQKDGDVYMTGNATLVCKGQYNYI